MKPNFAGSAVLAGLLPLLAAAAAQPLDAAHPYALCDGREFVVGSDAETRLRIEPAAWGAEWRYVALRAGEPEVADGVSVTPIRGALDDVRLSWEMRARQIAPRRLEVRYTLDSSGDVDLTYAVLSIDLPGEGRLEVRRTDGTTGEEQLPIGRRGLGEQVAAFALVEPDGKRTTVTFDRAATVQSDGSLRVVLAEELRADEQHTLAVEIELDESVAWYPTAADVPAEAGKEHWFTWAPEHDYDAPSVIGMEDWLDGPAGKYGRIERRGDELLRGGRPVKFWGVNLNYAHCAPEKELAERRAAMYAKYGINTVRLHKYADGPGWAGIQSDDSYVEFDRDALDRMDFFVAELKKRGIYTKLSPTFIVKLGPGDRRRVPYLDEFGELPERGGRVNTLHGSIYLSREIQDLQIEQVVRVLEHRNPYTGMTYAEDPAVAVVELYNEDSALFFGTLRQLQRVPTLRRRAGERFSRWLETRYGGERELVAAWGEEAIGSFAAEGLADESWEQRSILPIGNPWFFDPQQLDGSQRGRRQRLLDTMAFLHDLQNDFYARYVEAIRRAGYEGEILASNWQAGRAVSHYYNLHSDYQIGMIDRHNYFGGHGTMLRRPGSGILGSGLQQVADRPFMLSEWIHVFPNQWGVEGPAIIGAYGLGLQGWDVSYLFQNEDRGRFRGHLGGGPNDVWQVAVPQILGVFPAVARQVLRQDVRQSEATHTRYVHVPSLAEGRLGFEDQVEQQGDVKEFGSGTIPAVSLAAVRAVVEFTDEFRETEPFELAPFLHDRGGESVVASTGELAWWPGQEPLDGHFTIDTPGTQAVVGFAADRRHELSDVTITSRTPFAAIYVTARGRDATLADDRSLLVTTIARAHNTGMKYLRDRRLVAEGEGPIRVEPVVAELELLRSGAQPTVHVLDHDGRRTGRTLAVDEGRVRLDGRETQAVYYEIAYP